MNEFRYFMFQPIDPHVLVKAMPSATPSQLETAYKNFLKWYVRNGSLFFHDQTHQHYDYLLTAYCRANNLKDYHVFEDEDINREFKAYRYNNGYDGHYDRYEGWLSRYSHVGNDGIEFVSGDDLLKELEDILANGNNGYGNDLTLSIPAWFNAQIANDAETQKKLRSMPYQDYLKTNHWMKVRALTVFTFAAKCIGKPCSWNHEGMWFEYASSRHTHHISYKHRGNERFGDVCMLCDECHRTLHKGSEVVLEADSIEDFLHLQWVRI